jgi:tetratricopeptide (TPR) repeat protein
MNNSVVCPAEQVLVSVALGEPAAPAIDAHLAECASCRQWVEEYRKKTATSLRTGVSNRLETITDMPVSPSSPRPAALGKYLVVGDLGEGGQARVFRGFDPGLHREVAIKWSRSAIASEAMSALAREGKLLAELDHPGIVRVFDLDTHEGRPFLVLEYVRAGCDLREYAARENLSPRQAAALVVTLAQALDYAHGRGVIHQDVKPSNILVDSEGRPRLLDFGLAQWRDLWNKDADQPSGGTPVYMAPEQLQDPSAVTAATDVYGLGGVLFFLLTGQHPRKPQTNPILAGEGVRKGNVDWDPLLAKKLPRRLVEICQKALAPESAQRYPKALDLAADLQRFLHRPAWPYLAAAGVAFLLLGWGLMSFLLPNLQRQLGQAPAQVGAGAHQSGPGADRPEPAPAPYLHVTVARANKDEDLHQALPLVEKDKLRIGGRIPSGMKAAVFALTLTDAEPTVEKLAPLERKGDQFLVARPLELQGSPATEIVFVCAAPDQAPDQKDVAAVVAGLLPKARAKNAFHLRQPVSFDPDQINDPRWQRGRLAAAENDPEGRVVVLLDDVRQKLRAKFPFVAGIAFTHVARAPEAKAQRAAAAPMIPDRDGWGGSADDQKVFAAVMDRLLQTDLVRANYPAEFVWPPKVYIQPDSRDKYNAFAGPYARDEGSGKYLVRAVITEGYMDKIVQQDPDILAAIMGHELAHITRGHLQRRIVVDLAGLELSRDQEIEADLEGVRIAVAAGYPYRGGVRAAFREWSVLGDFSNFEGVKATHPSWAERLALLDKKQAHIWKAMAAFQNGYFFLHAEQYPTAGSCFLNVTEEFPDCAEAWANLGYTRLMQYCDGLEVQDLRKYGIAQVVAGCFYARPQGLIPTRGDEKMWRQAVYALERALERDPNLVLARANLGLAYLVHPDGEKKTDQALAYFRDAYNQKDKGLDDLNVAAFLVNYGVARLANDEPQAAAELFGLARKILPEKGALRNQLELALLYDEAFLAAASPDKDDKSKAFRDLEKYLTLASPDSTWWALAYDRYDQLGKELGLERLSREKLTETSRGRLLRVVVSVEVAPGKRITLSDPTGKVLQLVGRDKSAGVPVYRRSKVKRYFEAAPGIDLLAGDKLLAVFLTSAKAPPVIVQARGQGTQKQALRIGMTRREFVVLLKDQPAEKRYIDNPAIEYIFLPDLGLGVRFAEDRVSEIVVAPVPRKQGA